MERNKPFDNARSEKTDLSGIFAFVSGVVIIYSVLSPYYQPSGATESKPKSVSVETGEGDKSSRLTPR